MNTQKLKAALTVNGIYRRYENPLVVLQNLGAEANASFGFYGKKGFLAAELGFDKALATHFEHSAVFKESIYNDVKNGW